MYPGSQPASHGASMPDDRLADILIWLQGIDLDDRNIINSPSFDERICSDVALLGMMNRMVQKIESHSRSIPPKEEQLKLARMLLERALVSPEVRVKIQYDDPWSWILGLVWPGYTAQTEETKYLTRVVSAVMNIAEREFKIRQRVLYEQEQEQMRAQAQEQRMDEASDWDGLSEDGSDIAKWKIEDWEILSDDSYEAHGEVNGLKG